MRPLLAAPMLAAALLAATAVRATDLARPGEHDKCAVCGMLVAPHRAWVATAVLRDGSALHFDGAKDLFKFLQRPDRYLKGRDLAVERVLVTDYYALERIDAREAWFVVGSEVLGPMGNELVPFAREAEAREFLADHHGESIVRFREVGPPVMERLMEKRR